MNDDDPQGRRAYPRAPLPIKVAYRSTGSFLISYSLNLSKGGMFLESDNPLPVGTELTLKLQIPGIDGETVVNGRVAWVRTESQEGKPLGMGISFESIRSEVDQLIDDMVRSFTGLRILLVAGTPDRRRAQLAGHLRSLITCQVNEVENPSEATEVLSGELDLVVVDLDRTGEDVLALMNMLTACREAKVPVVALAANESKRRQAQSLGADEVLDTHGPHSGFQTAVLKALSRPEIE